MCSSVLTSLEDLFDPLSALSPFAGGGERLLFFLSVGVVERRDLREPRDTLRERVRRGVSMGVGSDPTGPGDSSSVSHAPIMYSSLVRKESVKES